MGMLFEQFIGLELIRCAKFQSKQVKILFWRDPDGPEVDWIIDKENQLTPIEVKWTTQPKIQDIKNLQILLKEYNNAEKAYLVCRIPRKIKMAEGIYAIPWREIDDLLIE